MVWEPKRKNKTRARRTGTALVASFQTAEPSLLWQCDLEKNHSFSLVLLRRENGWDLTLYAAGRAPDAVAHFEDYDEAEKALKVLEKTLLGNGKTGRSSLWFFWVVLALGVLWLGYGLLSSFLSPLFGGGAVVTPSYAPSPALSMPVKPMNGVPMSADDVLKPPAD